MTLYTWLQRKSRVFFARDGARLATADLHVVRCCAIIIDKLATMWATPRRSEGVAGGWRGRRGVGAAWAVISRDLSGLVDDSDSSNFLSAYREFPVSIYIRSVGLGRQFSSERSAIWCVISNQRVLSILSTL